MPWHRDFNHLKHVTITLWITAILIMFICFFSLRVYQDQVYKKVMSVENELKINTEAARNAINITQQDLKKLREEMAHTNKSLQEARTKLQTIGEPWPNQ